MVEVFAPPITAEDTSELVSDLENKPNKNNVPIVNANPLSLNTCGGGSEVFEVVIQKQLIFSTFQKPTFKESSVLLTSATYYGDN